MGTLTSILSLTSEGEEARPLYSRCANDNRKQLKNPLPIQGEGRVRNFEDTNMKNSGEVITIALDGSLVLISFLLTLIKNF